MRWFQILLQAVKLIHHKDIIKRMLTTKSNLYKKTKILKLSLKNYKKILFKDFPNLNIKIVQEYKNKTLIGSSGRLIPQKEQKENEFLNWLLFNLFVFSFFSSIKINSENNQYKNCSLFCIKLIKWSKPSNNSRKLS